MRIGAPIGLNLQYQLSQTTQAISRALEHLSSGKRVNSPMDDAAAYSMSVGLDAQIRGLNQAIRNMNDGKALFNIADGALSSQMDILQRMRELAVQAGSGTLSSSQRDALNQEFNQLLSEFQRITNETDFNGMKLLDGSLSSISLQMGSSASENVSFDLISTNLPNVFQYTETVGDGTFTQGATMSTGGSPAFAASSLGDFNGDGFTDVAVANNSDGTVSILLNNGSGAFSAAMTYSVGTTPQPPSVGDFNGDGKLDVAIGNYNSHSINVLFGQGDGSFGQQMTLDTGTGAWVPTVADFNEDGIDDIAEFAGTGNSITVYLGSADGTMSASQTLSVTSSSSSSPKVLDLNNDGHLDLVFSSYTAGTINIFLGNGEGTFTSQSTPIPVGFGANQIGDVNNDGVLDVVLVRNPANFQGQVYLGSSSGTLTQTSTFSLPSGSTNDPTLVDINHDGNLDVIASTGSSINVLLGDGTGHFTNASTLSLSSTGGETQVSDFNGDGEIDIAVASSDGKISVFSGNGDGGFTLSQTLNAGTSPGKLLATDLNGDGIADLLAANAGSANLSYYLTNTRIKGTYTLPSLSDADSASRALNIIDNAISYLSSTRSSIGSSASRLEFSLEFSSTTAATLTEAKSKVIDADMAEEMSSLVRNQILQQAQIAALTQANVQQQIVLQLLSDN